MKHKTLFRLALKAIGILLLGFAIPQLTETATLTLAYLREYFYFGVAPNWAVGDPLLFSSRPIGGLLQVAFALYLLFGGRWIVDRCIPSNRPYCPECGYDLSSSGGDRCVECGVALPADLRVNSEKRQVEGLPPDDA